MYIDRLTVQGIRNIQDADLRLSSGVNLFYGGNGSGKTSLLEAVHMLSRGRSFRTRKLSSVLNHESQTCTCFGLVRRGGNQASAIPIGLSRTGRSRVTFKVDGEVVTSASRLAETLPVQLVNSQSFDLLEGSPAHRRSFIDWGVFHVEHHYRELWSRFQRCLKHRNSLLRSDKIDRLQLSVWDREFCALSTQVDSARSQYLGELIATVESVLSRLSQAHQLAFEYIPGWQVGKSLEEALQDSFTRDRKSGFTHVGPHRGDLRVSTEGRTASDVLSRGQIKMLVFALKLAQADYFKERTGDSCVFLLDDLPAELDRAHQGAVSRILLEQGPQCFITGVDISSFAELLDIDQNPIKPKMFHVKHGVLSEQGA